MKFLIGFILLTIAGTANAQVFDYPIENKLQGEAVENTLKALRLNTVKNNLTICALDKNDLDDLDDISIHLNSQILNTQGIPAGLNPKSYIEAPHLSSTLQMAKRTFYLYKNKQPLLLKLLLLFFSFLFDLLMQV